MHGYKHNLVTTNSIKLRCLFREEFLEKYYSYFLEFVDAFYMPVLVLWQWLYWYKFLNDNLCMSHPSADKKSSCLTISSASLSTAACRQIHLLAGGIPQAPQACPAWFVKLWGRQASYYSSVSTALCQCTRLSAQTIQTRQQRAAEK